MSARDAGPRPAGAPARHADPRAHGAARDGAGAGADGPGENDLGAARISTPEWIVAAFGLALVLAVVVALLAEAFGGPATPPDIRVRATSTSEMRDGYLVHFEARNDGDVTAAALSIEGELVLPDGERETAQARLDYLPGRSTREGGLIFRRDPRRGTVTLRPTGFVEP